MSYFREIDPAGRAQEDLPSGWEEARKVTSILVDAATPKDGYTAEHAVEVARLSRLVGKDLGLNEDELEWLVHGALLHDLGKLGGQTRSWISSVPLRRKSGKSSNATRR
jgi:HD-GYP domain-containing protein (c-di-GMP phosphodiesterase class II)